MARNQEKAQTMLARFLRKRQEDEGIGVPQRRPAMAEECTDLVEAEKWRQQIIREISKNVSTIQNASLGEHKIRDLNDQINKLLRERKHWERQIVRLGGPDYSKTSIPLGGAAIEGSDGYLYFGAARDLPGVRELLEARAEPPTRKPTRGQLFKRINIDYYGFRDDDDGLLEKLEAKAEERLQAEALEEWKKEREEKGLTTEYEVDPSDMLEATGTGALFSAHIPLPSQEDIAKQLLEKRKQALLQKYSADAMGI